MLREVPEIDSQHQDIINNGRIKFRLLLLFPVLQVPFLTTASQGRKEGEQMKGSALPV